MKDENKTKAQLIEGLSALRKRVGELEGGEKWQLVLSRVREEVWKMRDPEDIQEVLVTIRKGLEALGIPFDACDVNIIDPFDLSMRSHLMMPQEQWTGGVERGAQIVQHIWQEGEIAYRRDVAAEDTYGERSHLEEVFGYPVRSVLDVPFSHGTLAVNSTEPNAFSEKDIEILQAMTEVLTEGFQRLEDIQQLQKSEERHRTLFENTTVGTGIADMQGHIIAFNDAMLTPGGYTREDIDTLNNITDLYFDPDEQKRALALVQRQGFLDRYEIQFKRKDGTPYDALLSLRSVQIQEQSCWQAVVEDITQRKEAEKQLKENERLLKAYRHVGQTILSSMNLDEILKILAEQIITAGIFRSLAISLVDEEHQYVEQVLSFCVGENGYDWDIDGSLPRYPLDDKDILAETARTGQMQVAVGWDDRFTLRPGMKRENFNEGHVAYFIPVKQQDRVVAVLATGSTIDEKDEVLHRIESMEPLLDQVAISLNHAKVYQAAQEEIADRKQAEEALKREYRLRDADYAIRLAVASMNVPQDLVRVLAEISNQLTQLGVIHRNISLQIVNEEGTSFFTVGSDISESTDWSELWNEWQCVVQDGKISFRCPLDEELTEGQLREKRTIIDVWKNGTFRYEPCIPDRLDFALPGMSVMDVAFSHGTLALNHQQSNAFGDEDIALLQRLAKIISEGFQRFLDITERKQVEDALREGEERYRHLHESITDGAFVIDRKWRYVMVNDVSANELVKIPKEKLVGKKITEVFEGIEATSFFKTYKRVMESRIADTIVDSFVTGEGRERWYDVRVYPSPEGILCIARDITEHKQMEQELIRLERLRAVGELSAGVSHNLNNILTSVLGPAQLLKRKTDDPELLREVDDIVTSAVRARDLVHQLHLSVRNIEEEPLQPVSIIKVLGEAVQTSRPRWRDETEALGRTIEVLIHGKDVPPIQGTEAGLHDILLNLIFNAVDALPEGGTITIEAQHIGDQVEVVFSDTGKGMEEEVRRKVFEPFFTTKMDIGTGLGLSTVWNTVNGWNGSIAVESEPGEGTTFTLRFPVWTEKVAETPEKAAGALPIHSGRILVVDDDEAVCSLLSRLLGEQHEVETTTDGRQALDRFAPGKYDVAMIDLGMSGMPGDRLLREMRQIDPSVATVLITGWDLPDTDTRVILFDFWVQKPFEDLDEVETVVAQAVKVHDGRMGRGSGAY